MTIEELKSEIAASPGGHIILEALQPFEKGDDVTYAVVAQALIRVQTKTMAASNARWEKAVGPTTEELMKNGKASNG